MYSYVRNNPLNLTDPTGEIINLSGLTDDERKELIGELEKDTGLTLHYNSDTGDLDVVGDPSQAANGSAIFREDLISGINSKDVFSVVDDPKAPFGDYDPKTKTAGIDFPAFTKSRDALTLGITFYHEVLGHGLRGFGDPGNAPVGDTSAVLDRLRGRSALQWEQKVAEQLGIPVRASYFYVEKLGRYYIDVMEPQSEERKRGWFTWRRHWDVDVTDQASKKTPY